MDIGKTVEVLGAVVLALGTSGSADAGMLKIANNSVETRNDFRLSHYSLATDGYESLYDNFHPNPSGQTIDFYSLVSGSPTGRVVTDARPANSWTTIRTYLEGHNVPAGLQTNLAFSFEDIGEDNFRGKSIFVDLYRPNGVHQGSYDVRNLAAGSESFPTLTIEEGLSHNIDIRFGSSLAIPEPSVMGLLAAGAAGLGAYNLRRRNRNNNRKRDNREEFAKSKFRV